MALTVVLQIKHLPFKTKALAMIVGILLTLIGLAILHVSLKLVSLDLDWNMAFRQGSQAFVSELLVSHYSKVAGTQAPTPFWNASTTFITVRQNKHKIWNISVDEPFWWDVGHPNPRKKLSVYSAFSFDRGEGFREVIVIAAYLNNISKISCQFHFQNGGVSRRRGYLKPMAHWDSIYAGNFIHCPLSHASTRPMFVSILVDNQAKSSFQWKIRYQNVSHDNYRFQFSICVQPVYHTDILTVFHFLEWFEFHKLMGVGQITLYDLNIPSELECVLDRLSANPQEAGAVVKIHSWKTYPFGNNPDHPPHGHGKSSCVHDCLYRHRGISKYVSFVDLDEFIRPRVEKGLHNYSDLIRYIDHQNRKQNFGEYRFRNGFYDKAYRKNKADDKLCEGFQGDKFQYMICRSLYLTSLEERHAYQKWNHRTKFIARPDGVEFLSNHQVMGLRPGYERTKVEPDVAFVHHPRSLEGWNYQGNRTVDGVDMQLGMDLVRNVYTMLRKMMQECKLNMEDLFK